MNLGGLLDHVMVDYYGTPTQLNQVAKVILLDSRTIGVTPFEKKMTQAIEKATYTIESIRARQQAWHDVSRTDQVDDARPARRARGAIVALDRAHALACARLDRAERQQAQRHEWFDTHSDLVAEHQLVRRAERARETQVRITAVNTPEPAVRDVLGPEPTIQRQRLLWRRAVETTALYNARHRDVAIPADGLDQELDGRRI